MKKDSQIFDVLIIGSGFGGSVNAMRLAQKGYRVAVLETGKRYGSTDFPKTNWLLHRFFWIPALRFFGPQCMTWLKGVMVLHGKGVGGGSLVYANTLMEPNPSIYEDDAWPSDINWYDELQHPLQESKQMLGTNTNETFMSADLALKEVAHTMNAGNTFHPTEVGVYFGDPNKAVKDPYFSGKGPDRQGCNFCGGCMVGCRHNAKNTLEKNYLYFAEEWGAQIFSETSATIITPLTSTSKSYQVDTVISTSWFRKKGPTFQAKKVILAAGVLGSVDLLLKNKTEYKTLPNISDRLGDTVRTNGESLLGATSFNKHQDFSKGLAIGSSFFADEHTRLESVRYPSGSGAMRLLAVPLTSSGSRLLRPLKMFLNILLRLPNLLRVWALRDWAKHTIILLVMQVSDQKMKLSLGRSLFTGFRKRLQGTSTKQKLPSYMPIAQDAAKHLAKSINGEPQNILSEVMLGTTATAHILGGCCIGNNPTDGVINHKHEVFGYPELYVCDGSAVPSNLGVNPSLIITALAERMAMKFPLHPNLTEEMYQSRQLTYGTSP